MALNLLAVPAVWAAPLLKAVQVESGILKGEFTATAHAGGMALRSTSPLTIAGISIAQTGKPLVRNVDLALNATADYAPKGWQAEVSGLMALLLSAGKSKNCLRMNSLASSGSSRP